MEPNMSLAVHHEMWLSRCENCMPCMNKVNCNACEACAVKAICIRRRCLQAKILYTYKVDQERREREKLERQKAKEAKEAAAAAAAAQSSTSTAPADLEKKKRGRKKGWTKAEFERQKTEEKERDKPTKKTRNQLQEEMRRRSVNHEPHDAVKQCLAPDCINSARTQSKYCSDECGKLLAKMRLVEVLPSRVQEYFAVPSSAETRIAEMHSRVRKEFEHLAESEKKLINLMDKISEFVQTIATLKPDPKEDTEGDADMFLSCVVCGQSDVTIKKYAKHVEACFVRTEKAVSYGAVEKSENPTDVFCDVYDQKQKTYCKRLKVLCPEHRKPGIERLLLVCGFPMKWESGCLRVDQIIEDSDPFGSDVCMEEQGNCMKHFRWIPTLLGIIQTEQIGLFYRKGEMMQDAQKVWHFQQWNSNILNVIASTPTPSSSGSSSGTTTTSTSSSGTPAPT